MKRKRITQIVPFLLPLRRAQKKFCFYTKMLFDRNRYARTKTTEMLPNCIYEAKTQLCNENTGFAMKYQENKVFNLRLAAEPVNGILIGPGETFSFWQLVRFAEKNGRYKEGLVLQDGKLVTATGGGLCHLSSFLFWIFLHTPLTIVERHPHRVKSFPSSDESEPDSVDATVSEGWLDLKVKNGTGMSFQIKLSFDGPYLSGRILTDQAVRSRYDILNRDKRFYKKAGKVYEKVSVYRQQIDLETEQVQMESLLYTDVFEIGYLLPETTEVSESED